MLSLGGFYPGFSPEPAHLRPLNRLGMSLDAAVPGISDRAEGYLAATSNTLQLGGRLEAGIDAGIASASGYLGLDALIQFSPFHFTAGVVAGFDVKFLGVTFAGVRLEGAIDGPGPVTLHGKLTIETFLKDLDWEDTFVFGQPDSPPAIPPRRAVAVLVGSEFAPSNVQSLGGVDPSVVLSIPDRQGDFAVLAPLAGGLAWTQHRVPLGLAIDRLDGTPLGSLQTVTASAPSTSGTSRERFAPGSFLTLTKAQALAAPTYDLLTSGVEVGGGPARLTGPATGSSDPQIMRKVRGESQFKELGTKAVAIALPAGVIALVGQRDQRADIADAGVRVTITEPTWTSTADGTVHASCTGALRTSMLVGGAALCAPDVAEPVTLQGL